MKGTYTLVCEITCFQIRHVHYSNKTMDIKENLKFIAQTGLITAKNIIGLLLLGLFINWSFAITVLVLPHFHSPFVVILLAIFFMVLAPIPYAIVGKVFGVRKGLAHLVNEQKISLIEYLIHKMLTSAKDQALNYDKVKNLLSKPTEWLKKLPKPVQLAADQLMARVPFNDILLEVAKNQDISEENVKNVSAVVAKRIDEKIDIQLLEPSTRPIWLLVTGNIALIILTGLAWFMS